MPKHIKSNKHSQSEVVASFKAMPFLMKFLFVVSAFSLISTLVSFIQGKPVEFSYFGSGFPKNFPFLWYLYLLAMDMATLYVYIKRSYGLLKKYLYITLVILVVFAANSVYMFFGYAGEARVVAALVYVVTYAFGGLVFFYLYSQKKYFHYN